MQSYPPLAAKLVDALSRDAAAAPERAVAFQGAPGAYSHLATLEVAPNGLPLPCFSFEDAFEAVETGRAGRAVIPIENSLAGRVADVHVLLPASELRIIGEYFLRVQHCLLAPPGVSKAQIRQAISHTQALGQTRQRLRDWSIEPVHYADTAAAAALVAEGGDPGMAAIASRLAADCYGLNVLAENIEDIDHNTTRFVILSRTALNPLPMDEPMMTSFSFEVRSIPAALFKALGGFATNGINMTKLESYQRNGSFTATEFYADIEGAPDDPAVQRAMDELCYHSKWVKMLGSYPQAKIRRHSTP